MPDRLEREGPTTELLRAAVLAKAEQEEAAMPRFTRRDAYLAIWGVVYMAVGLVFIISIRSGVSYSMGWGFLGSGGVSIAAAVARSPRLDVLAFTLLSAAAAGRGVWSLLNPEFNLVLAVLGALLWLGVAGAQVVVAGWPIPSGDGRIHLKDGRR